MKRLISKYTLEPYQLAQRMGRRQKHTCPACGKRTFVRYIDIETNQYISDDIGKCDREIKCAYHKKPNGEILKPKYMETTKKDILYIDRAIMEKTLKEYDKNNLFIALCSLMEADFGDILNTLIKYNVGTTKNGSAIYWQVDIQGNVRTGKVMQYDSNTCKRVDGATYFIHVNIDYDKENYEVKQCFFGEHLIASKVKNIVLVEAEKTAVICDIYFNNPDYVFVSCGSKNNINEAKLSYLKTFCDCLYLLPDSDVIVEWFKKSKDISGCSIIDISEYLDKQEIQEGYDIADMILNRHKALEDVSKEIGINNITIQNPQQPSDKEEYIIVINEHNNETNTIIEKQYITTINNGNIMALISNSGHTAYYHIPDELFNEVKKYELKEIK